MLEMRPSCECCDVDLPAEQGGAFICSFECTFVSIARSTPCTESARIAGDRWLPGHRAPRRSLRHIRHR